MRSLQRIQLSLAFLLVVVFAVTPSTPMAAATSEDSEGSEDEKWDVMSPPGDWTSITIDTTETTWTNVDVSPDGETIVFDMLGDLYTVPIDGGEAVALTDGIEWNFQPRYDPDGSKIVFVSDRSGGDNLWVMNADGSEPEQLTDEGEHVLYTPSWSPDGDYVVAKKSFTSTRSVAAGEIWLYHVSGGDGLQLTERPFGARDQKNMIEPAFSSDGKYLFYSRDTTSGRIWQYNKDSTGQIFVVQRLDLETGDVENFVTGAGGAVRPTPSPDGKHLAFIRRLPGLTSAIFLMDLASGREWSVFDGFERDNQESEGSHAMAPGISWTPDSGSIVFWTGGSLHRVNVSTKEVVDIPLHVRVEKKIQPALRFPIEVAPETFRVRMLRWAQMSPRGGQAVYQALGYLWVHDIQSGRHRRLTSQSDHFEFYPSISRDGRSVVYTTWDDQELGSIRVVSIAGGEGRVITQERGHYIEPSFSPNGRTIVYRKIAGGFLLSPLWSMDPGIYVIPASGGEATRVSTSGSNPQFAAADDRVFFSVGAGDDGTETELVSVNLDGFDERTHIHSKRATELRLSPNSRWISFTQDYDAYVAPFVATGKTVELGSTTSSVPTRRVSKRSGEFLGWSADSTRLYWSHGSTLFSRELRDAFGFLDGAPEELPEPVEEGLDLGFETEFDSPEGTIALIGGRVVTMRDAWNQEEVIEEGVVLVDGNRIAAVGSRADVEIPDSAHEVDVSGMTILPGLVDVHAHGAMARNELTPEQNWGQYANLAFGVTTVHDPSNDTSSVFSAAELQKAGRIVTPRIFSTGTILYGAHVPGATAKVEGLDDARFHVQRLKDVGAISVKSYQQPRRDQKQQVVAAGRELGIMVVPEGGMKFNHNMAEIVDGHTGIEHSLPIKTAYDDVLQLWSQTEVGYTPTFVVSFGGLTGENWFYHHDNVWENERLMQFTPRFIVEPRSMRRSMAPEDHYNHFEVARTAHDLNQRGVSVHIGAHGQRAGLAAHWELWMMEQGGFTPWEALRGGSLGGAWYVGLDGDIGSLEPGKLADLFVVDGNPLEDLRLSEKVAYTMINGRLFDASSMNELAPRSSEREPFFFELEGGDAIHPSTVTWFEQFQRLHRWVH